MRHLSSLISIYFDNFNFDALALFPEVINCKTCADTLKQLFTEVNPDRVVGGKWKFYQAEKPNGVFQRLWRKVGFSHILTHAGKSTHSAWARYFIDAEWQHGSDKEFLNVGIWCASDNRNVLRKYWWGYHLYQDLAQSHKIEDDPEFRLRWALQKQEFADAEKLLTLVDLGKVELTTRLCKPPMRGPMIRQLIIQHKTCSDQLDPYVKKEPHTLIEAVKEILKREEKIDQAVIFAASLFANDWKRCGKLFPDFCTTLFEHHPDAYREIITLFEGCRPHVMKMEAEGRHKLVLPAIKLIMREEVKAAEYLNFLLFDSDANHELSYIQAMLQCTQEKGLDDAHLSAQLGMLLRLVREKRIKENRLPEMLKTLPERQRKLFFQTLILRNNGNSPIPLSKEDQYCVTKAASLCLLYEARALTQIISMDDGWARAALLSEEIVQINLKFKDHWNDCKIMGPLDNAAQLVLSRLVIASQNDYVKKVRDFLNPFEQGRNTFFGEQEFVNFYGMILLRVCGSLHPDREKMVLEILRGFDRHQMPVKRVQIAIRMVVDVTKLHSQLNGKILDVVQEMRESGSRYCTEEFCKILKI